MALNPRDKPDSSPCVGQCTLTTGDKVCKGCGRTEAEFRDWGTFTPEQKVFAKQLAAKRKKELGYVSVQPTKVGKGPEEDQEK